LTDRQRKQRDKTLQRKYGITLEVFEQMLREQGGVCAICGGTEGAKTLNIDHSHQHGAVRGLLCTACNVAVGFYEKYGRAAARYLSRYDPPHITDDALFEMDLYDDAIS
jgi:hypothetical protein